MSGPAPINERARHWLAEWQRCIRQRDYEQARRLFHPRVRAFGTVAASVTGLDQLVARQWIAVWEHTRDFEFDPAGREVIIATSAHCVLALTWRCTALPRAGRPAFLRSGRASIVLEDVAGALRCIHSHFSLDPMAEAGGGGAAALNRPD